MSNRSVTKPIYVRRVPTNAQYDWPVVIGMDDLSICGRTNTAFVVVVRGRHGIGRVGKNAFLSVLCGGMKIKFLEIGKAYRSNEPGV